MITVNGNNIPSILSNGCVVALGTFDGLHLGHRCLINSLIECADGLPTAVYSFSNVPAAFFKGVPPKLICTSSEKAELLENMGVDVLVLDEFNWDKANETKEQFESFLFDDLKAKKIVVGFNYSYGAKAAGNADTLKSEAEKRGVEVKVIPSIMAFGDVVSSSRIRRAILEGDVELASDLLGRNYSYEGKVVSGNSVGAGLGFRTANIEVPENKLLPPNGVYVTDTEIEGRLYRSITNIGVHPTVKQMDVPIIETHIIDFSGDLYDKTIKIRLLKFVRPEMRFNSFEALKAQIGADTQYARDYKKNI